MNKEAFLVSSQFTGHGEPFNEQNRFIGLGLTKHMILPHYQDTKDQILDGKRLFEEISSMKVYEDEGRNA